MQIKFSQKKYSSIPVRVLFYIAWRNIISKKLRSSLTIIGVLIGIGAIFFLLSLGMGMQNLVTNEIIGSTSVKTIDITSPNSKIIQLDQDITNKIKQLGHVDKMGNSYSFAGSIKFNKSEVDTIVYGVDKNYIDMLKLTIVSGDIQIDKGAKNLVINKAALQSMGINDPKQAVDKNIDILIPLKKSAVDNKEENEISGTFKIIGVVDSGAGSEVYIDSSLFNQAKVEQFSQSKLTVNDTNNISGLRKQIESMGLETSSPIDTIEQINQIFKYFNIAMVGFGAIGMIVAILGMFNTLTISLLERTKEIGLMVALGARRKDMRLLFIIEAVLLSFIGSVLGIILAIISGNIINILMSHFAKGRGVTEGFDLFSTPWWLILFLILFMLFVGFCVVLLPARRAERINPIDALRRE